ncbi:MAG: hypothetical protein IPH20_01615 [Bacteroidales bacterium]|nr:hypothetical protein [Bacteroidales bacterium]
MKTVLISILFLNSIIAISQNSKEPIRGYYGENIKVRANISGTMITSAITRTPALTERGIRRVAVLTDTHDGVKIQNIGITINGNMNFFVIFKIFTREFS